MKPCLIISGGAYDTIPESHQNSFVIACDKGVAHAQRQGIRPDFIIGDFDSYSGALPQGVEVLRCPVEKDDTDTMAALKVALERGYTDVQICCAFGGLLDHLYANFQTAVYAAHYGARCVISDHDNFVTAVKDGSIELPRREGWSLSLFAVSDICRGVTISGAKYPLTDAELTNSFPLGVSNDWAAESAAVEVKDGTLLVILSNRSI